MFGNNAFREQFDACLWPRLPSAVSNYGDYADHRAGTDREALTWSSAGLCDNWSPSRPSNAHNRLSPLFTEEGDRPGKGLQAQGPAGFCVGRSRQSVPGCELHGRPGARAGLVACCAGLRGLVHCFWTSEDLGCGSFSIINIFCHDKC